MIPRVVAGSVELLLDQLVVEAESLPPDGRHLDLQDPHGGADGHQVEEDGGTEPGELLPLPVAESVQTLQDLKDDGDTDLSVCVPFCTINCQMVPLITKYDGEASKVKKIKNEWKFPLQGGGGGN